MVRKSMVGVVAGGLGLALALTACGTDKAGGFTVERVAQAGPSFQNPLDAVPGRDGATYFTADGPTGPGVFLAAGGGAAPRALAVGRPFRRPVGIALSPDAATLYVADAAADTVFTLPAGGGTPVPLAGTSGLLPRGLEAKGDQLYLTGIDPQSATPAVLALPAGGGQARVLATGLALPDGIAVADDGTVFVTDRFGGRVLRVAGGTATALKGVADDVVLGQPAGLAMSADGAALLVSSLDGPKGTAQVLIVDIASGTTRVFDDVIGKNHGAGGLHRSADGSAYAWADSTAAARGGVYRLHA
jgi:sugar lactone lactonase YvrE